VLTYISNRWGNAAAAVSASGSGSARITGKGAQNQRSTIIDHGSSADTSDPGENFAAGGAVLPERSVRLATACSVAGHAKAAPDLCSGDSTGFAGKSNLAYHFTRLCEAGLILNRFTKTAIAVPISFDIGRGDDESRGTIGEYRREMWALMSFRPNPLSIAELPSHLPWPWRQYGLPTTASFADDQASTLQRYKRDVLRFFRHAQAGVQSSHG
jgi:hypothetical protein